MYICGLWEPCLSKYLLFFKINLQIFFSVIDKVKNSKTRLNRNQKLVNELEKIRIDKKAQKSKNQNEKFQEKLKILKPG